MKKSFSWPQKWFFYIFLITNSSFFRSSGFCQFWKDFFCCFEFLFCSTNAFLYPSKHLFSTCGRALLWKLWATRTNFPVQFAFNKKPFSNSIYSWKKLQFNVPLITNLCSILFTYEKDIFSISFFFLICKNRLVNLVFLSFLCNFIFECLPRQCGTLIGVIFNT